MSIIWTAANFSSALRAVSPDARAGVEAALQGDVEAVSEERDEDARLDPVLFFMEDWPDGEVALEGLEGFFDRDELNVVLPAPHWRGRQSRISERRTWTVSAPFAATLRPSGNSARVRASPVDSSTTSMARRQASICEELISPK